MKIELLNERENFPEIFKESLQRFLVRYINWSGSLCWGPGKGLQFRQNARLNVIYPVSLPRQMVDEVTQEFRYHPNLPRRLAQQIYAGLAIRWPLENLTAPVMFSIPEHPKVMETWVFIPGNHSVRIIDFDRQSSIVFPKAGFDIEMTRRDASIRQRFPFLLAPKIAEAPLHGEWYIEERVCGLPLNRLPDVAQRAAAEARAVTSLRRLYAETWVSEKVESYLEQLASELDTLFVCTGSRMTKDFLGRLKSIKERASAVVARSGQEAVLVVQSHGDFQPANILVDGENVKIIDWEYSKPRSVTYDYLVYTACSRFASGLEGRLAQLLNRAREEGELKSWFGDSHVNIQRCFALFLLEELSLKLQESAASVLHDTSWNLANWMPEVDQFLVRLLD